MKAFILICAALLGIRASAHQHMNAQAEWVFHEAYNATHGACDTRSNPHSFACTRWNFDGNHVFPLFTLDWMGSMQGEWFTVTYVNPQTENEGAEFYMAKLPLRPSIPLGVINAQTGDRVGSMWIQGRTMVWNNWLGRTLQTDPNTFRMLDAHTVEMQAFEGQYVHMFRCRDFNRNNNHHLLCDWYLWIPQNQQWVHKGYMGFLTRQVWDNFARGIR